MNFEQFELHGRLMANIRALGYKAPTPIQEQTIPHGLEGRDVMGLAQTGTGKTAAYMLPLIQRLMEDKTNRRAGRALVIAPTRELAEQIYESARELGAKTGLRFVTVYGGVGIQPQLRAVRRGVDCVIACPGRLLDLISRGGWDFSNLRTLVLDEADHMFDMGFLPDLRRIMSRLPAERQTLMFSATMPGSIRDLAEEALNDPVRAAIKHEAPAETVSHAAYPVPQRLKTRLLMRLLDQGQGSSLIFTRTKRKARELAEQLQRAGHKAESLQGNLSQNKRQAAMRAFRCGDCSVLVATDIAARGIDVSKVERVFNYDMPDTPETYTHRVGRTGRAERLGQALSLTTREDVSILKAVERLLGKRMEQRRVEDFDYGPAPARGGGGERAGANGRPSLARPKCNDARNANSRPGNSGDERPARAQAGSRKASGNAPGNGSGNGARQGAKQGSRSGGKYGPKNKSASGSRYARDARDGGQSSGRGHGKGRPEASRRGEAGA